MAFSLFGKKDKNKDEVINEEAKRQVIDVPLDEILPNQFQPRTVFNQEKIAELAETIAVHGVVQPIIIREIEPSGYEIIAGERRYRAAVYLKLETIPAIVQNYDDDDTAAIALIENLQREQLTPIEEAKAYESLLHMKGVTQEALATHVGKSQSAIANKLRLLKLPAVIQEAVLVKEITERHARALLTLESEEQQETILNEITTNHWNVKQTELRIREVLTGGSPEKPQEKSKKARKRAVSRDVRIALNTIKQSVSMVRDTGMELNVEEEESPDFYKITIQIPKKKENRK